MRCTVCHRSFDWTGRGRRPSTCGQRCRKRKSRSQLPDALTSLRRWTRADHKRPIQVNGRPASSTDPSTWTDYPSVAAHDHGIMLGDGLACWDLDGVINDDGSLHPDAQAVLKASTPIWVERSLSGRGLHVFVAGTGPSQVGERVSLYTWGRFIRVTGDQYWVIGGGS